MQSNSINKILIPYGWHFRMLDNAEALLKLLDVRQKNPTMTTAVILDIQRLWKIMFNRKYCDFWKKCFGKHCHQPAMEKENVLKSNEVQGIVDC